MAQRRVRRPDGTRPPDDDDELLTQLAADVRTIRNIIITVVLLYVLLFLFVIAYAAGQES